MLDYVDEAQKLYLEDHPPPGIQEKYLMSRLTTEESLTSLDIKRFIVQTDTSGRIYVADNLSEENIGLILEDKPIRNRVNPYLVPMMVNLKTDAAPKWISVCVTVYPQRHEIRYQINSDGSLKEDEKLQIQPIVEGGVRLAASKIESSQRVTIAPVAWTSIQTEAKSRVGAGYRLLHQIYQNELFIPGNDTAARFCALEGNSRAIQQFVYTSQLRAIQLNLDTRSILQPQILARFDEHTGQIKDEFVEQAALLIAPARHDTGEHPLVREKVNELQLYSKKITFPGETPDTALTSVDFEQFLLLVHHKLAQSGVKKALDEIALSCHSSAVLEGLIAYGATNLAFPASCLVLNFHKGLDGSDRFLRDLKMMLLALSKGQLAELHLIDSDHCLDERAIHNLVDFVQENGVSINITLPDQYLNTSYQKKIDEHVSDFIRQRDIAALTEQTSAELASVQPVRGPVRKRPKLGGKQNLAIDIELQQEQQVQVQTTVEASTAQQMQGVDLDVLDTLILNRTDFIQQFSQAGDDQKWSALWCNWVGALSVEEADGLSGLYLSQSACEELLRYQDQFQYGLDLKNLPPGFSLKPGMMGGRKVTYVQFDENLKLLAEYNPLQVQTSKLPEPIPLTHRQLARWLEIANGLKENNPTIAEILERFNQLERKPYDKKAYRLFRQKLPQLLLDSYTGTPPDFANHLLGQLTQNEPSVKDKIESLISRLPSMNLNALLQIYIQLGEGGIDRFTQLINLDEGLFKQLYTLIFSHHQNHMPLLSEDYVDAMKAIQGFSPAERAWWNTLLAQHCEAQTEVNLLDLVNAFKKFKDELGKLPTNDKKPLVFPEKCELTGVKSLPVALSRLLTLLKHTKEQDRQAQWRVAGQLDLSSNGIIKAVSVTRGKPWAFITPQMHMSRQHEVELIGSSSLVSYSQPSNIINDPTQTLAQTQERFYRFVASQGENAQLALEFYQHVEDKLSRSGLGETEQQYLYSLLACASTTIKSVALVRSLPDANKDVDDLLALIVDMSFLPAMAMPAKPQIRKHLLELLFSLIVTPALPILNRLVKLIASSLSSLPQVIKNKQRLVESNAELAAYVMDYGNAVYDGMKDYDDEDYRHSELFFDHLAIVKKIHEELEGQPFEATELMKIISTFGLTLKTIDKVIDEYKAPCSDPLKELLYLLLKVSIKEGLPRLSATDLKFILDAVKNKSSERQVIDTIQVLILTDKRPLANYFPTDYLDNYGKKEIPPVVIEKIAQHFNELQQAKIKKILLQFSKPDDVSAYESKIVDKLIAICQSLTSSEKAVFITKLAESKGLYLFRTQSGQPGEPKGLTDSDNEFVQLLDVISANHSVNDFIYFMNSERRLLSNTPQEQYHHFFVQDKQTWVVPGLGHKALFYLNHALPEVMAIPDLNLSRLDVMSRLTQSILKTPIAQMNKKDYLSQLKQVNEVINHLVTSNPSSKSYILELVDRYLQHYSLTDDKPLVEYLLNFVTTLEEHLTSIEDKSVALSLCLQFCSDTDEELTPENLLLMLDRVKAVKDSLKKDAPDFDTAFILKIATELINNEKGYSSNEFGTLCTTITQDVVVNHRQFAMALQQIYARAPMPTITQVLNWHNTANSPGNQAQYAAKMQELYNTFGRAPCQRETVNGFSVKKAEAQLTQFYGVPVNSVTPTYFDTQVQAMRSKTPDDLLKILKGFQGKTLTDLDYYTLVAVAAELLHRSKGKDSEVLGSSMEINTTQYLAILSMLKTKGHVTSQIGTGEGKSRIMMIALACQFALGNTVDFVTADAQLAIRDFVEFKAYFDMIGAKTSIIFANTNPEDYRIGGINFSDPSNLSLFRNKAHTLGKGDSVLDPNPQKRALLLDEADKTYFDVADTRFNFSAEGDASIRDMKWIYPLLMAYFAQDKVADNTMSPLQLYFDDIDLSRENFIQFAHGKCTPNQLVRLKALSYAQIEQWQVSAVTASQLKWKDDFVIEPDRLIQTPEGPRYSSEAQLLFENRVAHGAKFSFGVQQCLHARLNLARENPDIEQDQALKEALKGCEHAFYIPDEKRIVYSSTSKNLLDDYKEGTLKAVTGTAGALIERQEAEVFYGLATGQDVTPMQLIEVPRDKGLHRRDKAIRLTKNEEHQLQVLIEEIKAARKKNQPILVITENDQESELLFQKLQEVFSEGIQHIHSQLSKKEEDARVAVAGKPQQITVSTSMIGRGTDISLQGKAKGHGLHVMLTYLPRKRDLDQIIGRSGRFGALGESALILDKARTEKMLHQKLPSQYYADVEQFIQREQAIMDRHQQLERLIKNLLGDFRRELTSAFFETMLKKVDSNQKEPLMSLWSTFVAKTDAIWNASWPQIQQALAEDTLDADKINRLLATYRGEVNLLWSNLRQDIQGIDVVCQDGVKPVDLLLHNVPVLQLNDATTRLLSGSARSNKGFEAARVFDHYSRGHDGRAVKYSRWTIPAIASLKGYANLLPFVNFANARPPFAHFRAWWSGTGQLFPNFRASTNQGKIVGAIGFGLIGAGVGAALTATGILAPIGVAVLGLSALVTSIAIFAGIGLALGSLLGFGGGAAVDNLRHRVDKKQKEAHEESTESLTSSRALSALGSSQDNRMPLEAQKDPANFPSRGMQQAASTDKEPPTPGMMGGD